MNEGALDRGLRLRQAAAPLSFQARGWPTSEPLLDGIGSVEGGQT